MSDQDRSGWIDRTTAHLVEVISGLGYTEDQCRELAEVLHDLPLERRAGEPDPAAVILAKMVELQGIGPEAARVFATVAESVDWAKLHVSSDVISGLLDIHRVTVVRHHKSGAFPAIVEHPPHDERGPGERPQIFAFDLARALRVISTDRHATGRFGRGQPRFID